MRAVGLILLGWALGVVTPFMLMALLYQTPQVDWSDENRIIEMDAQKKRHPPPPVATKGDVQPYEPRLPWPEFRDRPDR